MSFLQRAAGYCPVHLCVAFSLCFSTVKLFLLFFTAELNEFFAPGIARCISALYFLRVSLRLNSFFYFLPRS